MKLADKVAIVTGAGSGIGEATAQLLAREGARVIAADLDHDRATRTAQAIVADGGESTALQVDIAQSDAVEGMVERTLQIYGRLDVLHNSAGVDLPARLTETTEALWDQTFDVNVRGTMFCCKHAIPHMLEGGGGSIVNMASMCGLVASPGQAAYCASKGSVVLLTKQIAVDYAPTVRVNCVCPGEVDTPMLRGFIDGTPDPKATVERLMARVPVKRMAQAEEIARAVLFLASDDSSYITGIALPVDGGLTAL